MSSFTRYGFPISYFPSTVKRIAEAVCNLRYIDELNRSLPYFDSTENHTDEGQSAFRPVLRFQLNLLKLPSSGLASVMGRPNVRASNQQVIASFRWQGLPNIVAL